MQKWVVGVLNSLVFILCCSVAFAGSYTTDDLTANNNLSVGNNVFVSSFDTPTGIVNFGGVYAVSATTDGTRFRFWRLGGDGNDYYDFYIDEYRQAQIYSTADINFQVATGKFFRVANLPGERGFKMGSDWANSNPYLRLGGRIAGANPYVDITLDDTDDTIDFAPSNATIKGMDVNMDLTVTGTTFIILPASDPKIAGVLWNNAGTVTVSAG